MGERTALITGGSSGIGLALARMLAEEGHRLTIAGRRADKVEKAAGMLRADGFDVQPVVADLSGADCEEQVHAVVAAHRDRYGRLDVLCNNAGAAMRAPVAEVTTKRMDIQVTVNLRQIIFFYQECLDLLEAAAAEHRNAWVFNTSSITGLKGVAGHGVYSATKHALVGWTRTMNKELAPQGIKSCALCPDLVNTPLSDSMRDRIPAESMIQVTDIAEMVRPMLRLSPACFVPELVVGRITSYGVEAD